jgi:hypothetical protein
VSDVLIVLTRADLDKYVRKAHKLASHPGGLEEYVAKEFMEHSVLLGEATKTLLKNANLEEKKSLALEMFKVGGKLHSEWRESMLPMIRRLSAQGGDKQNGRRSPEQVPADRRLGSRADRSGRGGEGKPEPAPDSSAAGGDGAVEPEPVEFSDGD